ncbi:MAG: hypothetical protein ACR2HH_05315 [Chthoniobacterales bacterium]
MRTKTTVLTLVLLLAAGAICFAGSEMGTWKLNEAKSKVPPGTAKNQTVNYKAAGDKTKVSVDGTDKDGKATHNEWTGKFDGHDYPLVGDPTADSRAYRQVNPNTLELTNKKGGKVVAQGEIVMSADGKSRTVSIKGTDPAGKKYKSMTYYDKK